MNKIKMTRSQLCSIGSRMPELLLELGKLEHTVVHKALDVMEWTFLDPPLKLMVNRTLMDSSRLEIS
ncbi:hypothetical protein [Stenotrophomonas phage IME-SM1]|uniref:Uncharacterized protein n=1 Tax=Stenotrophomonas phage IME-SM1 TaxID=1654717 RepID=A0A0H4J2J6_9CAUD|nr:hypothetical protein KMC40_gp140 [Stenotrophomonas phage IME-SM1]AKO61618.1 hypothetical protein [Stenotrophomonas phage IME-SM1]QXN67325.1 hypothetical protein [Stenotrophomonas phage BUCT608]QYC97462.1 hypothetical protein [Stenotrophomonas phage BUCT608]